MNEPRLDSHCQKAEELAADVPTRRGVEAENRARFSTQAYVPSGGHSPPKDPQGFADRLLVEKVAAVTKRLEGRSCVLDLCCGTGEHLNFLSDRFSTGAGVDFSIPFLSIADNRKHDLGANNTSFVATDARLLPFKENLFDLCYCFSALYTISSIEDVFCEVARVLRPGGIFIFEMGNSWALNHIVSNAHRDSAALVCNHSVSSMLKLIRCAGFSLEEHRAFQILPYWGGRPAWMRPLLAPWIARIMSRRLAGKMLDEWVSNMPLLKSVAYRHLFVCHRD